MTAQSDVFRAWGRLARALGVGVPRTTRLTDLHTARIRRTTNPRHVRGGGSVQKPL